MPLNPQRVVAVLEELGMTGMPEGAREPHQPPDWDRHEIESVDWRRLVGRARDGTWLNDNWPTPPELLDAIGGSLGGQPPSGRDAREAAERRPEVCAFYQPIHFYEHNWGIYIYSECIDRIAADIARWVPHTFGLPLPLLAIHLRRAAFFSLFLHEAFHHKTEAFSVRLEVQNLRSHHWEYWDRVYSPSRARVRGALEEGLANADAYRRLGEGAYRSRLHPAVLDATRSYLRWRFPLDPPGYRDATRLLPDDDYRAGLDRLKSQVRDAKASPTSASVARGWDAAPNLNESLFGLTSDIWLIVPKHGIGAVPTGAGTRTPGRAKTTPAIRR